MDGFCDLTDTNVERSVNEAKGVETIAFKGAPERIQRERSWNVLIGNAYLRYILHYNCSVLWSLFDHHFSDCQRGSSEFFSAHLRIAWKGPRGLFYKLCTLTCASNFVRSPLGTKPLNTFWGWAANPRMFWCWPRGNFNPRTLHCKPMNKKAKSGIFS